MTPRKDGSDGLETGFYEVVPLVGHVWQRVCEGQTTKRISRELGVGYVCVRRLIGIFNHLGMPPSQARLAVCVLNHPDITEEQVADLFGRNVRWVQNVKLNRERLREDEPFPMNLEFLDEGLEPTDPTPYEIEQVTTMIRHSWVDGIPGSYRQDIDVPWRRVPREAKA